MARRWGDNTIDRCVQLTILNMGILGLGGWFADLSWPFYFGVMFTTARYMRELGKLNIGDVESCRKFFVGSCWYGFSIFLAILAGKYLFVKEAKNKKTFKQKNDESLSKDAKKLN